jgi:tetratricopeptide (TPR) repeat protein
MKARVERQKAKRGIAFGVVFTFAFCLSPFALSQDAESDFTRAVFFGKKFADMGDYAAAAEQYEKANSLKPDVGPVLYNQAVVLARSGRYLEAQVKAERYQRLFPDGPETALIEKLELELEFQRELQKRRQADQDYADLFSRARFSYTRGELSDALTLFAQAERIRPNDAAAVFNQAVVLEKQLEFAKAIERFRRYAELESDLTRKAGIDERVYALQREVDDMQTKIVCTFCGRKLPVGTTWCERCWHGPYDTRSPAWNSRPCAPTASATRATYYSDGRFNRNEVLPCLWQNGAMLETLRYSAARQQAIRNARKAEGWTYADDVLQGNRDLRFVQGASHLEKVIANGGGEILNYVAHPEGGFWLLDREDLVVDATRYAIQYSYDAERHITQQQVQYQNTAACNHLIGMTAVYSWQGDALMGASIKGGYDGYPAEGSPKTEWQATVGYVYDPQGRMAREEVTVTSMAKTYMQKPDGALRDEINRIYGGMRVKRPIENILRTGDVCAASGATLLANPIDLRPFYAVSPNLGTVLPPGVTKSVTTITY